MWLVGVRDGATIALLYAAAHPDGLAGAAIIAPQLFPEATHSAQLLRVRAAFETTDLRERLARYHDEDDDTADPASLVDWNIEDELHRLRCPLLAIRGFPGDEYSAATHIDALKRHAAGATPLETPARQDADSVSLNRTIVRFINRCTPLSQN
ncbi:lactonase [Caballeronia choica]|uniref:Lactonase n=2 Tax=Caballeronia choica TaxID=326476 RepID=A0A158JWK3_9BURK|nr:lactonase [Caballeronia choica]